MKVCHPRESGDPIKTIIAVTLCLFLSSALFAQTLEMGDELFSQAKYAETIPVYEKLLKENPGSYDLLWRISRSYSQKANEEDRKRKKIEDLEKSVDYAKQAVSVNGNDFEGHLQLATSLGKMCAFLTKKELVRLSYTIRDEAQKAIELRSDNYEAYLVLGVWNRKVAEASWIEKKLAKALFGGLPEASLEEAAKNIKKSTELNPNFAESHYELARVYNAQDKKDLAIKELEKALKCSATDKRQKKVKRQAGEMLARIK
ncbi:MAG: tetratricopeptide repeat protein [Candidatus Omnitrophica bacterium]|nr:tetratricopeptide repeat protein [Candidatus Omnitrophota bacterium]